MADFDYFEPNDLEWTRNWYRKVNEEKQHFEQQQAQLDREFNSHPIADPDTPTFLSEKISPSTYVDPDPEKTKKDTETFMNVLTILFWGGCFLAYIIWSVVTLF